MTELRSYAFTAMGCPCELKIEGSLRDSQAIAEECKREAWRFETKYSRYRSDSLVSAINAAAGHSRVEIDAECRAILEYADVCFSLSDGLFDITSGVLRRVWHPNLTALPTSKALASVLPYIGWKKVDVSDSGVYLPLSDMELDLGGIVKEYAADALTRLIKNAGFTSAVINLGGDLYCLGKAPGGQPWRIGVTNPFAKLPLAKAPLVDCAVATSGGYERYFEIAGHRYSHLLNPKSGWPVDGLLSVSTLADSVVVAGSLATIALLKDADEGLQWLADSGCTYVAVTREGSIVTQVSDQLTK